MNPRERAIALFRSSFGAEPVVVATAPGRVNLIGEHVDYHGGHVLPVATARRTAVALGPGGGGLRAASENGPPVEGPWPPRRRGDWTDYPAGVASLVGATQAPLEHGLSIAVASDLPIAGGLSSSAALEVATALGIATWSGRASSPRALAELAWRAETEFVGMPCGQMDQLASALTPPGSALLIDCRTLDMHPVPVDVDLVLAASGESRALRHSAYAERRQEGDEALERLRAEVPSLESLVDVPPARLSALAAHLPAPLDRRVRHVVNENQRTILAARALEAGDHDGFGQLVNASHDSLRDLYECSTARLDAIVEAARQISGVLGARLVGAGWGGSVLVVARRGAGARVVESLSSDDALALPGVQIIEPGAGAAS